MRVHCGRKKCQGPSDWLAGGVRVAGQARRACGCLQDGRARQKKALEADELAKGMVGLQARASPVVFNLREQGVFGG